MPNERKQPRDGALTRGDPRSRVVWRNFPSTLIKLYNSDLIDLYQRTNEKKLIYRFLDRFYDLSKDKPEQFLALVQREVDPAQCYSEMKGILKGESVSAVAYLRSLPAQFHTEVYATRFAANVTEITTNLFINPTS